MLSPDQVLHVARLARLELTPDEVERFAGELSKVLDHIELIGQLGDMADVPPTSHVIDVENALREDAPRPSHAGRPRAAERARRGAGRVPRAVSGSVMIELTAKQAADAIKSGDLDAGEYFDFYRQRAAADEFNSYIWVAEETPACNGGPFAGVPIAIKDLFCTEGIPSQAGSKILEDYRPPYTATSVRRLYEAGGTLLGKTNQDEFAMGSSTENSAYGPTLNPWDRTRVPGGSSGGSASSVAAGTAPWSIGTDTGGSIRQPAALCGIVGMKPTYGAISRYGMIAFASSLDQAGPFTRDVTDCALLLAAMVGADPCDSTSIGLPEPITLPTATDLKGIRLGVPEELDRRGDRARRDGGVRGHAREGARARRDGRDDAPAALPARSRRLLPDRARRSAAPTWPATTASATGCASRRRAACSGMYTATREAGFGAEVKRRVLIGTYALSSGYYDAYYGRAQKVRTLIGATSPAWATSRLHRHPDHAGRRVRARLQDRRPAGDVHERRLHGADVARRDSRDQHPERAVGGPADRLPARRPGVQREPDPGRRARARDGDRLRRKRSVRMSPTSPSSASRSTSSSRPGRRCSAAAS